MLTESMKNYGTFVGIARYVRDAADKKDAGEFVVKYLLKALEEHDRINKKEEQPCNQES